MKFFSPQRFSNFLNSTLLGVTFSRIVGDALMVYKKVSFSTSGVRSNVETFETGKEKKRACALWLDEPWSLCSCWERESSILIEG
jgi:hypothetical protein